MNAFSVPCSASYTAPWWFPGRHWQTLYGSLCLVKWFLPKVNYRQNERWDTPDKLDFIEVAWIDSTFNRTDRDLYVVFHGLEGDKDSAYARVLMARVAECGDRGVVVHFRGCGKKPNRLARSYHAGDSDEIDWILRRFRSENPKSRIFATGYSLGGAALLKWLGEPHRNSHEIVDRAAAVSAPVDLAVTAQALSRGFGLVYSWLFLWSLKPKSFKKLKRFPGCFDGDALRRARTLKDFEAIVTAPVHGFRDVDDYHTRGSAKSGLRDITVPTLIVTAENDPIVPLQSMDNLQVSSTITLVRPNEGGHAGFFCGRWPGVSNWIPGRLLRHFTGSQAVLPNRGSARPGWLALIFKSFIAGLVAFFLRRPRLLRTLVGLARRRAPIVRLFGFWFVTREDDVREVFERNDDFIVSPINERKMLTGDFLFSLDPSPNYRNEKQLSFDAFHPKRIARLESITDAAANTFLASTSGRFDAVTFAERVTVEIAKWFWGLDPAGARSSVVQAENGEDTVSLWVRKLAAVITTDEPAPFGLQEAGRACRDEYLRFVRKACDARRRSGAPGSDVMGCLVSLAQTPEIADRNVAGHIVTASAVVTKAFAHALEQLLLNENARARAIVAAAGNDRTKVAQLLLEALRFNPVFPMLTRYCPRNTTLAAGTARETEIPAGSTVVASPLGALFDPVAIENPDRFSFERTLELNPGWITSGERYGGPANSGRGASLIFSGGTHWCIGDEMALAELAAMAMAVLKLPNPRVAGPLRHDWSAVESLVVEYGR